VDTLSTTTRQNLEKVQLSLDRMDDQLAQLTATVKCPLHSTSSSAGSGGGKDF
jgi:hypothetical protein